MQNLLALETSGARCSVCLLIDGTRFGITEHVQRRHNELLLSMIEATVHKAGLTQRELASRLDVVAFGCGPGSFTGVRIAAAAAQAIAFAAGAGVVPVVSSRTLALAVAASGSNPGRRGVITLIRSRKDLYYFAMHRIVDGIPDTVRADQLCARLPLLPEIVQLDDWTAVGSRPDWWPENAPVDETITAGADEVCTLALAALRTGAALDPADALPLYLTGDSPWRVSVPPQNPDAQVTDL
ncbi:MAG: tRNA (adenosine(37)-N6)-threonylcarbamoyltransferase complex dimerization subunit type 1 TsaB [Pseudomonadales bacterium]|nr:tRNA (adenosine(37)-N6)-threonylcarbamoyltransferase complex dimerization subunit type 1 TsaB [Pseudomonadales bacterium]